MRMERIAQKERSGNLYFKETQKRKIMMTKNFYIAAFVVSMLAFSSCKIGKRYVRPELNLPDRIEAYTDTTDTASVENIPWRALRR